MKNKASDNKAAAAAAAAAAADRAEDLAVQDADAAQVQGGARAQASEAAPAARARKARKAS